MKKKIHPIESSMLEMRNENVYSNSRLACSISLKPYMNEMIIRIVRQPINIFGVSPDHSLSGTSDTKNKVFPA